MKHRHAQSGVTLVMSLIMLIVLTLLVVSAIRFSNINLRLAGNAQTQAESAAAAQVAIDQVLVSALAGNSLSAMAAASATVSTGGASYTVAVAKPACNMTQNIDTSTLDPSIPADRACFGLGAGDPLITSANALTSGPSACKNQMWDIAASVGDTASGSSVSLLQGASLRVSAEVSCPAS
jgi:hypothetical protein